MQGKKKENSTGNLSMGSNVARECVIESLDHFSFWKKKKNNFWWCLSQLCQQIWGATAGRLSTNHHISTGCCTSSRQTVCPWSPKPNFSRLVDWKRLTPFPNHLISQTPLPWFISMGLYYRYHVKNKSTGHQQPETMDDWCHATTVKLCYSKQG